MTNNAEFDYSNFGLFSAKTLPWIGTKKEGKGKKMVK
jgi:hypothetical protein